MKIKDIVESYYDYDDDNFQEWIDGEWEQKHPYASRGLSKSDFY